MRLVNDRVFVSIYQPERFKITKINSLKQIIGVIFEDTHQDGETLYIKYEYRNFDEKTQSETIQHIAFKQVDNGTPQRIPLSLTPLWADLLDEVVAMGTSRPLFAYYKTPIVQNIDYDSPLGISYFHLCSDLIREADLLFSDMLWEYEGSKLKVFAEETLLPDDFSSKLKRLFVELGYSGGTDNASLPIETHSPDIRYSAYISGLDSNLKQIEDTLGLSRGVLSTEVSQARTATEIKILKQRTFATITGNQKELRKALVDVAYAMYYFKHDKQAAKLEITFDFDDSIINDKDKEQETAISEVSSGLMSKKWYLMNVRRLSEEEAAAELLAMADEELAMVEKTPVDKTME